MSLTAREALCTFRDFYLQQGEHALHASRARDMLVAAAHRLQLDEDSVLEILTLAVDGLDERTLKVWLSTDLESREGEAREALTALGVIVDILGSCWGTLSNDDRHRVLEIGSSALLRANRHLATGPRR